MIRKLKISYSSHNLIFLKSIDLTTSNKICNPLIKAETNTMKSSGFNCLLSKYRAVDYQDLDSFI